MIYLGLSASTPFDCHSTDSNVRYLEFDRFLVLSEEHLSFAEDLDFSTIHCLLDSR